MWSHVSILNLSFIPHYKPELNISKLCFLVFLHEQIFRGRREGHMKHFIDILCESHFKLFRSIPETHTHSHPHNDNGGCKMQLINCSEPQRSRGPWCCHYVTRYYTEQWKKVTTLSGFVCSGMRCAYMQSWTTPVSLLDLSSEADIQQTVCHVDFFYTGQKSQQ